MSGETTGVVRVTLRVEGLCILIASMVVYSKLEYSWSTFAIFFLAPDLSFLGYLAGSRIGAVTYNTAHSYIGALLCLAIGLLLSNTVLLCTGAIWSSHVGLDRALGFGLKYASGFSYTHLGVIGRLANSTSNTTIQPKQKRGGASI